MIWNYTSLLKGLCCEDKELQTNRIDPQVDNYVFGLCVGIQSSQADGKKKKLGLR